MLIKISISSKFMKYILYARKSTDEDDRQILSIEAQLAELKEFVAKEKLEIAASFQEAKTAKEPVKNIDSNFILSQKQTFFKCPLANPDHHPFSIYNYSNFEYS